MNLARQLADARRKALAAAMESADAGHGAKDLDAARSRWLEAELLVRLLGAPDERPAVAGGRQNLADLRIDVAAQQAKLDELDRQIAALPAPATQPAGEANGVSPAVLQQRVDEQRQRVRQVRTEIDNFDRQYATLRTPTSCH
jgi:hypothetical protein